MSKEELFKSAYQEVSDWKVFFLHKFETYISFDFKHLYSDFLSDYTSFSGYIERCLLKKNGEYEELRSEYNQELSDLIVKNESMFERNFFIKDVFNPTLKLFDEKYKNTIEEADELTKTLESWVDLPSDNKYHYASSGCSPDIKRGLEISRRIKGRVSDLYVSTKECFASRDKVDTFVTVVIDKETLINWLDFLQECNALIGHLKRYYNSYKTRFGVNPF